MVFHSVLCSWKVPFTGEKLSVSLSIKYCAFVDYPVCDPVHFSDESELISLSTLSEFLWSVSHSYQPVCAFPCFDEVSNREARTKNILIPWVVELRPAKGIYSGVGWCSEREVAQSNVKGVFLADGRAKGLRRFVLTTKNTSCLRKCGFQLGRSWKEERNIIPVPHRTSGCGNMEQ
jgi:hypothetical protein